MEIGKQDFQTQVRRLRVFLNPKSSKLRAYLALFGIKNHIVLKNGCLEGNNPSISWYTEQLAKANVSENYWGIRNALRRMARVGIFKEMRMTRTVSNPVGSCQRFTKLNHCEYYLDEKVFPALHQVLKEIFGVDSLSSLSFYHNFDRYQANKQTDDITSKDGGKLTSKQSGFSEGIF
jgi:hypothetical protein